MESRRYRLYTQWVKHGVKAGHDLQRGRFIINDSLNRITCTEHKCGWTFILSHENHRHTHQEKQP